MNTYKWSLDLRNYSVALAIRVVQIKPQYNPLYELYCLLSKQQQQNLTKYWWICAERGILKNCLHKFKLTDIMEMNVKISTKTNK